MNLYKIADALFGVKEPIDNEVGFNYAFRYVCRVRYSGIISYVRYLQKRKEYYGYQPKGLPYKYHVHDLRPRLIINPRLAEFNFVSVIDPYSATQELSMFIGNDLARDIQPVMPVGSDKVIAESKGFDKWSFRKPPEQ